MDDGDAPRALEALRTWCASLVADELAPEDYELSAQMKDGYASEDLAHVAVNKELKSLGREAAAIGDRQAYVYCIVPGATKAFQKAKDPVLARETGLKIDRLYYLTSQVSKPLLSLFECFGPRCRRYWTSVRDSSSRRASGSVRTARRRSRTLWRPRRPARPRSTWTCGRCCRRR